MHFAHRRSPKRARSPPTRDASTWNANGNVLACPQFLVPLGRVLTTKNERDLILTLGMGAGWRLPREWAGSMDKLVEKLVSRLVRKGSLEVHTSSGQVIRAGDGSGQLVAIRFGSLAAAMRLLADPELALGELYMNGELTMLRGNIYELLELGLRNLDPAGQASWLKALQS
eukprot:gene40562-49757_t